MKIKQGSYDVELIGGAVFLNKQKILALSDLHMGYEEGFINKGVMIPKNHFKDIYNKLKKILIVKKPKKVVFCGDIKHEFGKILSTEWRDTLRIIDLITKYSELVFVRGNHDKILNPIAKKRNILILNSFFQDGIFFIHGDKLPNKKDKSFLDLTKAKLLIIGHQHPAVILSTELRKEKFRCYLFGTYNKHNKQKILVLPPFNPLAEGINILEKIISPFLENIENFEIFVYEDKIYDFGKVKKLRKIFS